MTILEVLPLLLVTIAHSNKNSGSILKKYHTRRKSKQSKEDLNRSNTNYDLIQILNSKKTSNDTLIIEREALRLS
jgi:hypothetical protein